jgi:hypothetical protein
MIIVFRKLPQLTEEICEYSADRRWKGGRSVGGDGESVYV